MTLNRDWWTCFAYLKKMIFEWEFSPSYIEKQWLSIQFCKSIPMVRRESLRTRDWHWIALETNDSEESCVQSFWWIQEIIPHIEVHSTLHKKWIILNRVLSHYSDEFKKLSHTLRFIAHYIRNEWFSSEFCSTILINSRNYLTHWDS